MVVDAAGAAPTRMSTSSELGADVVAVERAAWGGPQSARWSSAIPDLLDRIPSMSLNPSAKGAERLEVGGHQYALLAGLVARSTILAALDESATGTRRERLELSISSLQDYHDGLFDHLMKVSEFLDHVMVIGRCAHAGPHVSFTVEGMPAVKVVRATRRQAHRHRQRIHGGSRLLDALGVNDEGGAVTIGLAPYTTRYEIDQLVSSRCARTGERLAARARHS